MSLKVNIPGGSEFENHPDIGDLNPGWSQTLSATPHVVGNSGGSVTTTAFSGRARAESDLLLNTPVSAVGDEISTLGNILSTNLTGNNLGVTSYDVDSLLLPVRDIPMVRSGQSYGAGQLLMQVYGLTRCLPQVGTVAGSGFWSMRGHDTGFSADGQNIQLKQGEGVVYGFLGNLEYQDPEFCGARAAILPFLPVASNLATRLRMRVRRPSSGTQAFRIKVDATPDSSDLNMGKYITVGMDFFTSTLSVSLQYRNGGVLTTITDSVSLAGLDLTKQLDLGVTMGYATTASFSPFRLAAYVFEAGTTPATPIQASVTTPVPTQREPLWSKLDLGSTDASISYASVSDYLVTQTPTPLVNASTGFVDNYVNESAINWLATYPYQGFVITPVPAWRGSGWEYMKMLCSARNLTATARDGVITVKNRMDQEVEEFGEVAVEDTIDGVSLSMSTTGRAAYVDVVNQNSRADGVLYSSRDDGFRSFSVGIGEEVFAQVRVPGNALLIDSVDFGVQDGEGLRMNNGDYPDVVVEASVSEDNSTLNIYIRGGTVTRHNPSTGLLYTPGWKIVDISVRGAGVIINPETIRLYTGADPSTATQESGGTVNNPFLGNKNVAYDRGAWAAWEAGTPAVSIVFDARIDSRVGGQSQQNKPYQVGEITRYGNTSYRIMSVRYSADTVSITAVAATTTKFHDYIWSLNYPTPATTVAKFDAYWDGYRCIDGTIRPLQRTRRFNGSGVTSVRDMTWKLPYPSEPVEQLGRMYPQP